MWRFGVSRAGVYLQTALLAALGLGLFLYKAIALGFPLVPEIETEVWTLQARFTIDARTGPVKATLRIPHRPPGFTILDENFVSRGYGLSTTELPDGRLAEWAIRRASGRQTLYYRARVTPEERRRISRSRFAPPRRPSSTKFAPIPPTPRLSPASCCGA